MRDSRYDAYARAHEERFEERHGALRAVVGRSVTQYLDCDRLIGGFARVQCETCRDEHLLAFSCRRRNLCASCEAKRSAVFGEKLRPAYETLRRVMKAKGEGAQASPTGAVPGAGASIQTFGSYANFHPHVHALLTEGVFAKDGAFHAVAWSPPSLVEEVFRRLLLAALVRAERLSEEFAANLSSGEHGNTGLRDMPYGELPERLPVVDRWPPLAVETPHAQAHLPRERSGLPAPVLD